MPNDEERISLVVTKVAVVESRLDGHEDICAVRYGEIATAFASVQTQLEGINKSLRGALITIILLMVGATGTVLYNGWPWEKPSVVRQ